MIRFGLRLTLAGGREAAVRLLVIAAAVALGTGLLLATLAGMNGVSSQNLRYAWLNTGMPGSGTTAQPGEPDSAWWMLREDYVRGQEMARVEIAGTGPGAPVPPGIPALPAPGEFYASPALADLLRTTPADELGDRFPGHQVGTVGPQALPAPDSLVVVIGRAAADLSDTPGAVPVKAMMTTDPGACDGCYVGLDATSLTVSLSVVAAALLVPVLIFIATATRLAAARREQRFAAMRLVGATPRQISQLAAVESTIAAALGTLAGFATFLALRPGLAAIPFTGAPFFLEDLSLSAVDVLAVAVGVPALAAVAARFALRRVRISPLGVTRRVTARPPRAWRLVPLLAGVGELAYFIGRRPETSNGQLAAYLTGAVVMLVGLVVAGPWLTMAGARLLARTARRPETLVAGRRLADNPQAAFRAVSGLVVALFVTSGATGAITTFVAHRGAPPAHTAAATAVSKDFHHAFYPDGLPTADQIPAGLASIPGVTAVIGVRENPRPEPSEVHFEVGPESGQAEPEPAGPGLVPCAVLAGKPELGSCAPGAQVARVFTDLVGWRDARDGPPVWPSATFAPSELDALPLLSVVVATDGSATAIEKARTLLGNAFPVGRLPATVGEFDADSARTIVQFQQLANVVILASLPIAGCSLAVSVAGGLADRKRPFSLLRLTGVRVGALRRVVLLESALPLLVVSAVAAAAGFLAADLFLRAQLDYTLVAPGAAYYAIVGGGLLASLGVIASTMPLLRRITGPETARND